MLTGVTQWKGNVHIHVGDPLTQDDLEPLRHNDPDPAPLRHHDPDPAPLRHHDPAGFSARLCTLLDSRINTGYKCFPSNYIAHDLLHGTSANSERYSPQDKDAFIRRLDKLAGSHVQEKAREIYLRIYANPVQNLRDSAPFAGR